VLLLIDAGNTRIKWGVPEDCQQSPTRLDAVRWRHLGALDRADVAQLAQVWQGLGVSRVLVSNVAGAALRDSLQTLLLAAFGAKVSIVWFASLPALAGVRNSYRNPAQLGCDRFAALVGARALFAERALLVATCGTATTVDAMTAAGDFIGGMILPGFGVMAASLARNTAQLPHVEQMAAITTPFADNTADAIVAGCLTAQAGAIERALALHRAQQGEVLCVLAGGAAPLLAAHMVERCEKVDNLVLIGLHVAATDLDQPLTVSPLC